MKKEELKNKTGNNILIPLGLLVNLFSLLFLSSPFIFIWGPFTLAWKLGLTGFIGTFITYGLYKLFKLIIDEEVDKQLSNSNKDFDIEK